MNLELELEITFCEKDAPEDEKENEFVLWLSLKMKYNEFAKLVGKHLKYDYQKLQFYRTPMYDLKKSDGQPIKYNPEFQLKDALNLKNKEKKIYFKKLNKKIS